MKWTVIFPVCQSVDSADHFCRCLQASDPPAVPWAVMCFFGVFLPPSGSLKTHLWEMPATSPRLSKCMSVWLSLSDKADTPQKQLSDACLRPNLSPCCKYVISMNKGRFQTGFARRRAIVICFFSPAPSFSLSTDKQPPVSFCCYSSVSSSHRVPEFLSLLTYKWASRHFWRDSIQLCCPIRAWSIFSSLSRIQPGGGRRLHLAKHVQKELKQNEGEGKKEKKEIFLSSSKAESVNSRQSVQKVSAKTQPPHKGLSQLYLASAAKAWQTVPGGNTESFNATQSCSAERSVQQSAGWRDTETRVAMQIINH